MIVALPLLHKYMCQGRERETGKQKHNHAEHRVWIFLGVFGGTEGFFLVQVFHFSLLLDQVGHLPVPSENVSRRGKKIWKMVNLTRTDSSLLRS